MKRRFWRVIFTPRGIEWASTDGPVRIVHDTTEFTYSRESTEAIGIHWAALTRYVEDGNLEIDNNGTENDSWHLSTPVENSPFCRSKNPPPGGGDGLQFQPGS